MATAIRERYLPLSVAAEQLGVGVETLRRWYKQGQISIVQLVPNGHFRISLSEIERLQRGQNGK